MATITTDLSTINQLAYLGGLFNWQMIDGSYINPNGKTTSFHVITNFQVPIENYISGAINTYNLLGFGTGDDPNLGLFNTNIASDSIEEHIDRKWVLNRVPYANYDQLTDLGTGSQHIMINIVIAGTMYLTALTNIIQSIYANDTPGLGTLNHPFYGTIKNVLPSRIRINYTYSKLNCVIAHIEFHTSDISHLSANSLTTSLLTTIGKWFGGTQNAITSMTGTVTALQSFGNIGVAGLSGI